MRFIAKTRVYLIGSISYLLVVSSCTTVDLYEKTVPVPGHAWQNSFRPSFDFMIKDTASPYQLYMVLRHNEKYPYTNIYVNLYIQAPGQDSALIIQRDLTLATSEKGWLATGTDDIYEHRVPLGEAQTLKAGKYTFTLEQIMRDNPLPNIFDVGIRVEKKP